jgi:IS1 family transposase
MEYAEIDIDRYYIDNWGSYSKYIQQERHRTGKDNTWKIERKNLNFGTHLKHLNRKPFVFQRMKPYTTMLSECILKDIITKRELIK